VGTGPVVVAVVVALLLVLMLVVLGVRRRRRRERLSEAAEHRREAELHLAVAEMREAKAAELTAMARREEAQAREQAELAEQARELARARLAEAERLELGGAAAAGADTDRKAAPAPDRPDEPTPPTGDLIHAPAQSAPSDGPDDRTDRLPVDAASADGATGTAEPTDALPVVPGAAAEAATSPHRHVRPDGTDPPPTLAVGPGESTGGRHRAPAAADLPADGSGDDEQRTEPRGEALVVEPTPGDTEPPLAPDLTAAIPLARSSREDEPDGAPGDPPPLPKRTPAGRLHRRNP
jgi:hypothetical protein